jgi:hypothetical protein
MILITNSVQPSVPVLSEKVKSWLIRISRRSVSPMPCPSGLLLKKGGEKLVFHGFRNTCAIIAMTMPWSLQRPFTYVIYKE